MFWGLCCKRLCQRVIADVEANFSASVLKSPAQVSHRTAPAASSAHGVRKAQHPSAPRERQLTMSLQQRHRDTYPPVPVCQHQMALNHEISTQRR